jgi:serine protease DegQ
LADSFRLPSNSKGVLIAGVKRGGPADRAGVRAGDILVEVEGKPVPDSATMLNLVAEVQPGKLALLKVVRNSNSLTVKLTVGKRPPPRVLRGEAEE